MMSSEYFTAAGYEIDGDILCVPCGERRKLPVSDQITAAVAESDFAEDGLWCGDCGAIIVQPPLEEIDEDFEYDPDMDMEGGYGEIEEGGDLETD
jgi:hypothetical protein